MAQKNNAWGARAVKKKSQISLSPKIVCESVRKRRLGAKIVRQASHVTDPFFEVTDRQDP
jgi:hypothetical protein